jgi:hypothetical protein
MEKIKISVQHMMAIFSLIGLIVVVVGLFHNSDYDFTLNPIEVDNYQGNNSSMNIEVHYWLLYDEDIHFEAKPLPPNTHINFEPDVIHGDKSISNVTISTDKDTPSGDYDIQIIGNGADGKEHSCNFTLKIIPTSNLNITSISAPTITTTTALTLIHKPTSITKPTTTQTKRQTSGTSNKTRK